jgi:hypothetical protein
MKRFLTAVCLSACLTVPATLIAQQDDRGFFDQEHNDYHKWSAAEDSAWRRFLSDHHRTYHDFPKASEKEQRDYWRWRHAHPNG